MWRFALLLLVVTPLMALGGPKVTVVIGTEAPALEKLAAQKLTADLQTLFEAEVQVQTSPPAAGASVILLGSPATNAGISADAWPKQISRQGHVLKSTPQGLIAGGGSPVATLWAVSELSYRFGMRHLLQGDVPPIDKPEFKLSGFDLVLDTDVQTRAWDGFNGQATGLDSWTPEDLEKLLSQLVSLKFTHLVLPEKVAAFEPLPVTGDAAGRTAFKGTKMFANAGVGDVVALLRQRAPALGLEILGPGGTGRHIVALGAHEKHSVLPQFSLHKLSANLAGQRNLLLQAAITGDLNAPAHLVSRFSFDPKISPEAALSALVTPICGEGVDERLLKGFNEIEKAADLIAANAPGIGVPGANMFVRHLESKDALPAWITEAKTLYTSAMSEMYRANTRARGGARPFILYHAKRCEFAMQYFITLESLYKAHDASARDESLEAAIEASYNSLNAYADVARDPSDRGVIALLNRHGYHALQQAVESASK